MNNFNIIIDIIFFVITRDHFDLTFLKNIVVVFVFDEHVVTLIDFEISFAHVQKFKISNVLILYLLHQRD